MGWGNIYRRRMKVFTLAFIIYFDYKALQQREKWNSKSKRAALWEKAHERNAKRVLSLMIELEGLWVKLGQYLSTRADVLPEAYICLLKQLQDSLPPRPLEEVCQTIQTELGKNMNDLFSDFVKAPLATASIAQVHRATLRNGQEVVVKVQHEGIKTIILEDLKNAKSIIDWIAWAEPQYDFNPMIDEWCKEAPKELDFNHEAENTRTVSRNLRCNSKCDDEKVTNRVNVLIPEVIQSTEKVLILEYMDGVRLNDHESLEALGVDKRKVVQEITRAYAHQIYVNGFFNGDPHPGNFLVSKEPPHRPILLDFGLTKLLSSAMKLALAKMFLASIEMIFGVSSADSQMPSLENSVIFVRTVEGRERSIGEKEKNLKQTAVTLRSIFSGTIYGARQRERGDHVALLSAFAEMGLQLRLDMPEQAMEVTNAFFRTSTPANEAPENMKSLAEQRTKGMKVIQEKMKLNQKQFKRFNPIDAFPGDIVIFTRVINLLRGLSSTLNVRIVYSDIMRPFAESVLLDNINEGPTLNSQWIYETPTHSDLEAKLRKLMVELGNGDKILGIQVCAYKDGEVIIDTAAGVLGRYDPRPVRPDSLFPVFSVTKGITAGMLHWLVDNGKLKLEENVPNIWPEFGSNRKDLIKVHHVLNHTSGLHNALAITRENPLLMSDWDECLNHIALSVPETEPGHEQLYHYLSFGWLCGGIIEHASGKKFQQILEEAFIHPLKIEGELYIGIPPGVESRLATLTVDMEDLSKLSGISSSDLPSTFQPDDISQLVNTLPVLFNMLNVRRAIIPAANGHCSARALARYYATLVDSGVIPPPHSSSSEPPLGSHPHIPKFPSQKTPKKQKGSNSKELTADSKRNNPSELTQEYNSSSDGSHGKRASSEDYTRLGNDSSSSSSNNLTTESKPNVDNHQNVTKIFSNIRIHDACMGVGEYENLVFPNGKFGLGFRRFSSKDGSFVGFGHSGMGGSTGFCDIKNRFAIAVTVNKMSFGSVTASIIQFVCSELNILVPEEFSRFGERGPEMQLNLERPLID